MRLLSFSIFLSAVAISYGYNYSYIQCVNGYIATAGSETSVLVRSTASYMCKVKS